MLHILDRTQSQTNKEKQKVLTLSQHPAHLAFLQTLFVVITLVSLYFKNVVLTLRKDHLKLLINPAPRVYHSTNI